jgi:hypothetical protein
LSWKPNVGCAYIARHVLTHDHGKNVKTLEAKLHMLAQLVNDFGIPIGENAEIGPAEVFAFLLPALEHRNPGVRAAAAAVYVNAHKFIGELASKLLGDKIKPSLRASLSKAVMEDPHKDSKGQRPKTPAAFIFDRPSTAADRLAREGGWQSQVGLTAAPILAQMGIQAAGLPGTEEASEDASPKKSVHWEGDEAPSPPKATEADVDAAMAASLAELTGDPAELSILKQMFGEDVLLQLREEDRGERQQSIETMQQKLWENGPLMGSGDTSLADDANASFSACLTLVKHALRDSAMDVQSGGLDTLKALIVTHNRPMGAFEMRLALGSVANMVLGLCADGPIRLRASAEETAIFLCQQQKVGVGLMSRYLLESATSSSLKARKDKGRAVVLARLKLLDILLDGVVQAQQQEGSSTDTDWKVETVATFAASCLAFHPSSAVSHLTSNPQPRLACTVWLYSVVSRISGTDCGLLVTGQEQGPGCGAQRVPPGWGPGDRALGVAAADAGARGPHPRDGAAEDGAAGVRRGGE